MNFMLTSSKPSPANMPAIPSGGIGSCNNPEPSFNDFNASVKLSASCGSVAIGAPSSIPCTAAAAASVHFKI